jgi:hypothetical protein
MCGGCIEKDESVWTEAQEATMFTCMPVLPDEASFPIPWP